MDLFISETGQILKFIDTKINGLYGINGSVIYKAENTVRKLMNINKISYFLRIEKKNSETYGSVAAIEYSDLLEVIRAIEKMTGEMDADMAMMPYYLENRFITVDNFMVGYYVGEDGIVWFIRLDEYGNDNYLFFGDQGKDGGAYILDNFKKAAAMIEEMMRQDGTNAG